MPFSTNIPCVIFMIAYFGLGLLQGAPEETPTCTNGFPTLDDVEEIDGEVPDIITAMNVTQWIFPNMTFTCSGKVTRWTFRGRTTSLNISGQYPMFIIWEEYTNTPDNCNDYRLRERSGSAGELVPRNDFLYQYVLEPPLEVREGDVFGMYLPLNGTEDLLVEFGNMGKGNASESFFSNLLQSVIDLLSVNIQVNNEFFPLVTAEISLLGTATTSQLILHPATSTVSAGLLGTTASNTMILPTVNSDLTVSSSSSQQPMLTLMNMFITSTTTITPSPISTPIERQSNVDNAPVIIAVVVSVSIVAMMFIAVVEMVIRIRRRQKKHQACDISTLQDQQLYLLNPVYQGNGRQKKHQAYDISTLQDQQLDLHNPVYQGVMEAELQGGNTASSASYHMYAIIPDQQSGLPQVPKASVIGERYEMMNSETPIPNTENSGSSQATFAAGKNGVYELPVKEEGLLYEQLKKMGIRPISKNTVRIVNHLGSGQFGTVSKGKWEVSGRTVDVAVKMLKAGSAQEDKVKFLQEAAIMGQFAHPNVVQLYGVVTSGNTLMIVLELLVKGDLRKYLISLRPNSARKVEDFLEYTLLHFCRQIASGLSYLAAKAFIHRDLAARNILVAADSTCKVADFGMSRDLVDENYYIAHAGKIPIKWTAPEALHFKKYSPASDVWSYGVLMYEIWSLGRKPFEGYDNSQAIRMIDRGYRLAPPPGCPRAIYDIMIKCWHPTNSERPNAAKIAQWLSHPDPQLLRWSEEDRAIHPEAWLLGAELKAARELYKKLQETYYIVLQNANV